MEIKTAKYQDFGDILKLQPLAYKSEGQIYDDFRIPPPLQTEEEIKTEFSEKLFLKAIDEHGIRTITTKTTVRDIMTNTPHKLLRLSSAASASREQIQTILSLMLPPRCTFGIIVQSHIPLEICGIL